ncbi:MAG: AraC family transcriptional regulator, partial [bacterium]|nr:AraC family transcriptional regulator [bacterium]
KNLLIFSNEHMTKKISSKNNLIVDEIKNYVLNNIDRSISLDDLASELHYSPNYLNYIFKQEKGQTISDFITGVSLKPKTPDMGIRIRARPYWKKMAH